MQYLPTSGAAVLHLSKIAILLQGILAGRIQFGAVAVLQLSTIAILLLTVPLAVVITKGYISSEKRQFLFWSIGLWLFAVGVLLEVLFAFGIYSVALGDIYLLNVVILVEALALGSLKLIDNRKASAFYAGYIVLTAVALLASLVHNNIGNILVNGVVFGVLPLQVVLISTISTFPAAIIIITVAAYSYIKSRSYKMLSIIAGVIIVSIAGTLYIVQFPAFLYYSEFFGILLLWIGFV